MSGDDQLTERLRATFIQELDEQVQELNGALLALEQGSADAEVVQTLFRAAHTIKGAARVTGVDEVERACHALESVFSDVRDGTRVLDADAFSLLFAAVDALADAGARLRARDTLQDSPLQHMMPRIEEMAERAGESERTGPAGRAGPIDRREGTRATAVSVPAIPPRERGAEVPPAPAPVKFAAPRPHTESAAAESVADSARAGAVPAAKSPSAAASPPAGDASPAAVSAPREAGEDMVRVRADRLDALLSVVGELIIATGRVVERSGRDDEEARHLDGVTDQVAAGVRELRLRPFADVCEALPRVARDVASSEGKEVRLVLEGQNVEADRMVVDTLRDPLLHLVRNAVDHGIEDPAERERAGKPRVGTVEVAARLSGGRLRVTVSDDGSGLDERAIRDALKSRGMPAPESSRDLADALLSGRFSTRREATTISGRGVGVDIARSAIERIGGSIDVEWEDGVGTTFLLECPPTPASIRAVLVRVGPHTFALPTAHVERLQRIRREELRRADGRLVTQTVDGTIAVHSLAGLLGPPLEVRPIEDVATMLTVSAGTRRAGLLVDEVLDEDEIMVRPMTAGAAALPYAAGAAVLPSGRVAVVLGVGALLVTGTARQAAAVPAFGSATPIEKRRVLVADDSITTRTLEQSVLEAAGYDVVTAVNGEDAWQRLAKVSVDIIVADVEMPKMSGIDLCRRVRASRDHAKLPIVLVTGLSSEEDRARGLEAGADAYIVKSSFDQADLLETVGQLIGPA